LPDAGEKAWLLVIVETADRSDIELRYNRDRTKRMQEIIFMPRDDLGRFVPGTSGNPGGRPKPPDGLRTRLAELSPLAVERLGELLDSVDERVRLEAAKTILDRHLGRPAIQADINLCRAEADDHLAALIEVARRRSLEPIMLEDVEVEEIDTEPLPRSR
jgi:hypothetical protein